MEKRVISTQVQEEDIKNWKKPASADAWWLYRTAEGEGKFKSIYWSCKTERRGVGSRTFLWTSGTWKDDACGNHCKWDGHKDKGDLRSCIGKPGEMAAILNGLSEGDILFVDEIHRLNRQVEEVLYPAMEDYAIDIMIGKGESAKSIRFNLPKFTLVGATTRRVCFRHLFATGLAW